MKNNGITASENFNKQHLWFFFSYIVFFGSGSCLLIVYRQSVSHVIHQMFLVWQSYRRVGIQDKK